MVQKTRGRLVIGDKFGENSDGNGGREEGRCGGQKVGDRGGERLVQSGIVNRVRQLHKIQRPRKSTYLANVQSWVAQGFVRVRVTRVEDRGWFRRIKASYAQRFEHGGNFWGEVLLVHVPKRVNVGPVREARAGGGRGGEREREREKEDEFRLLNRVSVTPTGTTMP